MTVKGRFCHLVAAEGTSTDPTLYFAATASSMCGAAVMSIYEYG